MKICFDEDLKILLEVQKRKNWKMGAEADYTQFILSKKGDTEKELGCLKTLIQKIPRPDLVLDCMAGAGLSSKLIQKYWGCEIILNDFSKECFEVLKTNYPGYKVFNEDGLKLLKSIPLKDNSLIWIDFNNFSWKKKEKYLEWFEVVSEKTNSFLFTDASIFGLSRFGSQNLKVYGIESINEYWSLLNSWLTQFNFYIQDLSFFSSASFIYCTKTPKDIINIHESVPLKVTKETKTLF